MKLVLAFGPVFILLLAPRTLLAVEQPLPAATEPAAKSPAPFDSPAPSTASPVTRTTQQTDPDVPIRPALRPSSLLPSARPRGPNEAFLVAGELLVGSLTITGVGIASYYAISYAPPSSDGIPRSTTGSTALNLGGVAALFAGPAIAGWLVCAIGRLSPAYEGGCGATIGFAAAGGLTLALVADRLTERAPPAGCDECTTTHSGPATVIGYIAGVALWFNPAANQLEGTDPDTFRTPVPGEPRKNRAAMAVLIEAALTCLTGEDHKD